MAGLVLLAVAAVAWVLTVQQSMSMGGMRMGLGPPAEFAVGWAVMMMAMMLPSALPLVATFAREYGRRQGWRSAAVLLAICYIVVWLAFGVVGYLVYGVVRMPWADQRLVGAAALAAAAVYSMTPVKRASQARCRELCSLHGPLPFNIYRAAARVGFRYGLSCLGCSAALMVAMLVIGMSSLGWTVAVSGLVLAYKLLPAISLRSEFVFAVGIATLGAAYALIG